MKYSFLFIPVCIILCITAFEVSLRGTPYPELENVLDEKYSPVITDRNGEVLRVLPLEDGLRREFVPFKELPEEGIRIFVESEDKRFFYHRGVDGFAVLRSLYINFRERQIVSGASTITMQLASLLKPREQSLSGKILEAWDAMRIEARLSKRQILELWLNALPFGNRAEGIGSGSRVYFNKSLRELSPAELAVLAVIPKYPAAHDPVTNPEVTYDRALQNSRRLSITIQPEQLKQAVAGAERGSFVFHAPHFVNQIRRFGIEGNVRTTLDLGLQKFFRERLQTYQERYERNRISSGAGILLDNHTGEILAYIGSVDFFSAREGEQIDGVFTQRQPGSCLKPFLYAAAVEEGWLPNALLPDVPLDFGGAEVYTPSNFTNTFAGPVRMRVALASSLNVPSVYVLNEIGYEAFKEVLTSVGFSLDAEDLRSAGLGAALGNLEVNLFELTKGFAVFPRRGVPLRPRWILSSHGDELSSPTVGPKGGITGGETVMSVYTADLICDILSDPAARALGFGYNTAFTTPFPVMFKTGTSDQFQNIWALGATSDYTVGVWMGNNTGQTVIGRTGSSVPARIAAEVLLAVQEGRPEFPVPENSTAIDICAVSGQRVTENCPAAVTEYFPSIRLESGDIGPCSFHIPRNGRTITEYPEKYHAWITELNRAEGLMFSGNKDLQILHPRDNAIYYIDPSVPTEDQAVRVEAISGKPGPCTLLMNGREYSTVEKPPYVWYIPLRQGQWEITVSGPFLEDSISIKVR